MRVTTFEETDVESRPYMATELFNRLVNARLTGDRAAMRKLTGLLRAVGWSCHAVEPRPSQSLGRGA